MAMVVSMSWEGEFGQCPLLGPSIEADRCCWAERDGMYILSSSRYGGAQVMHAHVPSHASTTCPPLPFAYSRSVHFRHAPSMLFPSLRLDCNPQRLAEACPLATRQLASSPHPPPRLVLSSSSSPSPLSLPLPHPSSPPPAPSSPSASPSASRSPPPPSGSCAPPPQSRPAQTGSDGPAAASARSPEHRIVPPGSSRNSTSSRSGT